MTHDKTENVSEMSGHVKWFDPVRGFGFVTPDDQSADILLHANVLRNFGQGSVVDGSLVRLEVQKSERGLQAVTVLEIVPPEENGQFPLKDLSDLSHEAVAALPIHPSRVKWFDKGKGFGFANVFGDNADVFIHIEVLRRSGLADLQSGEAIGLRIVDGERGQMAVAVLTWEAAVK